MIEPTYQISATFSGDPGSFSIKAQDDTLDVELAAVAIDSRLRTLRIASAGVYTPNMDAYDCLVVSALSGAFTLNNPVSVNPMDDQRKLLVRVTDDGSSHGLFFGNKYYGKMKPLPTTTVAGKEIMLGFLYDAALDRWDLVATYTQP